MYSLQSKSRREVALIIASQLFPLEVELCSEGMKMTELLTLREYSFTLTKLNLLNLYPAYNSDNRQNTVTSLILDCFLAEAVV